MRVCVHVQKESKFAIYFENKWCLQNKKYRIAK